MIGRSFATYDKTLSLLTLHSDPPSTLKIPTVGSLFTTVIGGQTSIFGITPDYLIVRILANVQHAPPVPSLSPKSIPSPPIKEAGLELVSVTKLPLGNQGNPSLKFIIPVDPMGWTDLYKTGTRTAEAQVDALLSVSEEGELVFWAPECQPSPSSSRSDSPSGGKEGVDPIPESNRPLWKCTGTVRTGRKNLRIAACSSTKKSVLGIFKYRPLTLTMLTCMASGTP